METQGRPAARYSRTFRGLALSVSSFSLKGINATSKPLQYAGRSAYGLRPRKWTLGKD